MTYIYLIIVFKKTKIQRTSLWRLFCQMIKVELLPQKKKSHEHLSVVHTISFFFTSWVHQMLRISQLSSFTRCTVYIQMSLFAGTWHSLIHQKYIYISFFTCHNLISLLPIEAVPLSSLSVVSFALLTDMCDSYWRAL